MSDKRWGLVRYADGDWQLRLGGRLLICWISRKGTR